MGKTGIKFGAERLGVRERITHSKIAFVKIQFTVSGFNMITFEVFWYVANVQRCDQGPSRGRSWESSQPPLFHYICHLLCYHTSYIIHPPLHHHLFSVKENVATYSCLITFGSLAAWRRKFGAWLESSMRDSRCSTVSDGTPSYPLLLSTMDSNAVLYRILMGMLYGRKAWERLLIDIWKVANNGAGGGEKGG